MDQPEAQGKDQSITPFDRWCYTAQDTRHTAPFGRGGHLPLITTFLFKICDNDHDRFDEGIQILRKAFEAGQAATEPMPLRDAWKAMKDELERLHFDHVSGLGRNPDNYTSEFSLCQNQLERLLRQSRRARR